MGLFRPSEQRVRPNAPFVSWADFWGSDTDMPSRSYTGKNINVDAALKNSVVYAAATLIADAVSSLPPVAQTIDPVSGKTADVEVPQWILKPHPEMRRSTIWNQLLLSVLLWGNAYALFTRRPSDGAIIGLLPLKPSHVQAEWDPKRPGYRRYSVDGGQWLDSQSIFHIQGPTLPGEAKGMSVIGAAREAIGLGLTLEEFGARYFAQGSMAKVILKSKQKIGADEAKQLVKIYEQFHKGPGNWHRPAVMAGDGDIENISIPPEDAQFLQTREFQALDIARWFRVPPHRVGIVSKSSSWGSGIAEENVAMVQVTYRPWILRFEDAFTAYAPGGEGRGLQIKLVDSSLLRGTWQEQVTAWSAAVMGRLVTPNEARAALGYGPLPDGDKLTEVTDLKGSQVNPKGASSTEDKEADRERKQEEKSAPKAEASAAGSVRHLPGKHNQKAHAGGKVATGTRMSDLDDKGRAAVGANDKHWGITAAGLEAEIESGINPASLAAGRAWYDEAHGFANELATKHGVSTDQAAAIISATSPRTPWPRNKLLADRVLSEHSKYPDGTGKEAAKKIGGGLSNNLGPGVEIARGGSIDQHLTGVKRRSFYNNIVDPKAADDVTVDTWMQRAAMKSASKPMSLEDSVKYVSAKKAATGGAGAGYVSIAEATRAVAAKRGIKPHEAQAAYW